MAEKLMVVLKRSESSGFGFSLLGAKGPPHIIYEIIENSPAYECKEVEAGDVIVKVNGTDVHRFTTKEVLKCLRLSDDSVTLELKRDPKIKEDIKNCLAGKRKEKAECSDNYNLNSKEQLTTQISQNENTSTYTSKTDIRGFSTSDPASRRSRIPTAVKNSFVKSIQPSSQHKTPQADNLSANTNNSTQEHNKLPTKTFSVPRFETYVMTGDVILNLSRTSQCLNYISNNDEILKQGFKSPHLHQQHIQRNGTLAPRASGESSPSSSPTYSENSDCGSTTETNNIKRTLPKNCNKFLIEETNSINKNISVMQKSSDQSKHDKKTNENLKTHTRDINSACSSSLSSLINIAFDSYNVHSVACSNTPQKSDVFSKECSNSELEQNRLSEEILLQQRHNSSSSSTFKSDNASSPEGGLSLPTSPTSSLIPLCDVKSVDDSIQAIPNQNALDVIRRQHNGTVRKCDAGGFRTSKSEDHLQQVHRDGIGAVISIDIDEDVNSSLNTLLDTRDDSEDSQSVSQDRIVWTYNAPVSKQSHNTCSPNSNSSSVSLSPQRSNSPMSPTSVSSSVISSNSNSKDAASGLNFCNNAELLSCPTNGDQSVSEAVSYLSSPDYQDDDNLLSSKDLASMALSDPSDSDSTILISDAIQKKHSHNMKDSKIDSEDELITLTEDTPTMLHGVQDVRESSPPVSDDGSDIESLHSYHYSPKAVDIPSAVRLAKRLYLLDGFKKSDVSRHLSKNNDFSRAVADEYLKYFNFGKYTLDEALREFLHQFSLSGETQERERVLIHFSKRYLDCNPSSFNSQDAVHTLTCAIMLLNTDLHGQNIGRKMTCAEFIDNLSELNDGENFPKDVLKHLYQAIKNHPLEWALDDSSAEQQQPRDDGNDVTVSIGSNPFLDTPNHIAAIEYKKGYVMRKCCYESNNKKTPFGRRSWKMYYCTLRDLVLYLHKDEHGFKKNQMTDNVHNVIRIHHALATKASDYTKKQQVFRLQTADQSEFLFQTSDSKELQSWIDTINFVCAAFSAPPIECGVGSQKRFQRPLLPSTQTKLLIREQLSSHNAQLAQLEIALFEHKRGPMPTKGLPLQNYREKESYLQYEIRRYQTYVSALTTRILSENQTEFPNCLIKSEDIFSTTSVGVSSSCKRGDNGCSIINPTTFCSTDYQGQLQDQGKEHFPTVIIPTDAHSDLG